MSNPDQHFSDVPVDYFRGGRNVSSDRHGGLADLLGNQRARQRGVIPAARCSFNANPSNNDTVTIAGHVFKFVTVLGAAAAQTQIKIGADLAHTLATLVGAVNDGALSTDTNVVVATTPFAQPVLADSPTAGILRIRFADAQGGAAIPASAAPSVSLSATLTAGGAFTKADLDITGSSELTFTAIPTAGDTVVVGTVTYEFKAAQPPIASNPAFTAVFIDSTLALTLSHLVEALNNPTGDALNVTPGTTAQTADVVADAVSSTGVGANDSLRLRQADGVGGTPRDAQECPSMSLAASITGGGAWDVINLNVVGKLLTDQDYSVVSVLITAAMVTAGTYHVELPFTPSAVFAFAQQDAFTISGSTVTIAMDDGLGNAFFNAGETARAIAFA